MTHDTPDRATLAAQAAASLSALLDDIGEHSLQAAVAAFESDVHATRQALEQALSAGDTLRIRRAAHRLKGLFEQFAGATPAALAAQVEQSPDANLTEHSARLLALLSAVVSAVVAAAAMLGSPGGSGRNPQRG